jgi:hypothetical protein
LCLTNVTVSNTCLCNLTFVNYIAEIKETFFHDFQQSLTKFVHTLDKFNTFKPPKAKKPVQK